MNLFDRLVTEALKNQPKLSTLRIVVEKELLHHDILKILSHNNLLKDLTFIGGTCLRACYGAVRLSEDLDFTGGSNFSRKSLANMGQVLIDSLQNKYGLLVKVSEPIKDKQNVDTWKIKIQTKPKQKNLPSQHINIDICAVTSYEKRPMMLINPYGVDLGTSGLIIQSQSLEEIYTDKLLAFALRTNRIKYRDLWDIIWLHNRGLKPAFHLVLAKLKNRNISLNDFLYLFNERKKLLIENRSIQLEFKQEMCRFLPTEQIDNILQQNNLWDFLIFLITDLGDKINML